MFERAGVYRADADAPLSPIDRQLPVNFADGDESDIRPAAEFHIVQGNITVIVDTDTSTHREVWRWFALAALCVLLLEWVVFTRRMHL